MLQLLIIDQLSISIHIKFYANISNYNFLNFDLGNESNSVVKKCIICHKQTKRIKGRVYSLHKCDSTASKKKIVDFLQANNETSGHGVNGDILFYHKVCFTQLERLQKKKQKPTEINNNSILNSALTFTCGYIKRLIIQKGEIKTLSEVILMQHI